MKDAFFKKPKQKEKMMTKREIAESFNHAIEKFWQEHMKSHGDSYRKELSDKGINNPEKVEELFLELKREIQLRAIELFKGKLDKKLERVNDQSDFNA